MAAAPSPADVTGSGASCKRRLALLEATSAVGKACCALVLAAAMTIMYLRRPRQRMDPTAERSETVERRAVLRS